MAKLVCWANITLEGWHKEALGAGVSKRDKTVPGDEESTCQALSTLFPSFLCHLPRSPQAQLVGAGRAEGNFVPLELLWSDRSLSASPAVGGWGWLGFLSAALWSGRREVAPLAALVGKSWGVHPTLGALKRWSLCRHLMLSLFCRALCASLCDTGCQQLTAWLNLRRDSLGVVSTPALEEPGWEVGSEPPTSTARVSQVSSV